MSKSTRIMTLGQSINAKRITHALYQNMGDEVVHLQGLEPWTP